MLRKKIASVTAIFTITGLLNNPTRETSQKMSVTVLLFVWTQNKV